MKPLVQTLALLSVSLILAACQAPGPQQSQDVAVSGAPGADTSTQEPKTHVEANSSSNAMSKPGSDNLKSNEPIAAPAALAKPKHEQNLSEGTELYDKGDYKGAIRKLLIARDSADEAPTVKQESLRLLAFSYCVTGQRALCKTQFTSLLKISPEFQLSRAEAGHPLWGPVFKEAKASTLAATRPAATSTSKPVKKP